jgi:osmotically-inducible protein OsmY
MRIFVFLVLSVVVMGVGAIYPAFADESAANYIDDAAITTKVKEAFTADSHLIAYSSLRALEIKVTTDHGDVILSGMVDNQAQEQEALKIASQVNGVTAVTDNLVVTTRPTE